MKGYITKNFRWEEFENSSKAAELGIDNTIPDDTVADNIRALGIQGSAAPQGRLRTSAKNQLRLPLQGCTTRSYTSPKSVTARNADKSSTTLPTKPNSKKDYDLRNSIYNLGAINGEIITNEVFGNIFVSLCREV